MRLRSRPGFTILELLVVLTIVGIVIGITIPSITGGLAQSQVQRAASVLAADLELAHSVAARQRRPVRIMVDAANRAVRIVDHATPTTVYSRRDFGPNTDLPVQTLKSTHASVVVYPNGLAASSMAITLQAGDGTRVISMSRAGQVRVSGS